MRRHLKKEFDISEQGDSREGWRFVRPGWIVPNRTGVKAYTSLKMALMQSSSGYDVVVRFTLSGWHEVSADAIVGMVEQETRQDAVDALHRFSILCAQHALTAAASGLGGLPAQLREALEAKDGWLEGVGSLADLRAAQRRVQRLVDPAHEPLVAWVVEVVRAALSSGAVPAATKTVGLLGQCPELAAQETIDRRLLPELHRLLEPQSTT